HMLKTFKGKDNYADLKKLKEVADQKIKEWLIKDEKDEVEGDNVFELIQAEPSVKSFFAEVKNGSSEAANILEDLLISWDIYTRWRKGSHKDRISYMRKNFMENYKKKLQNSDLPKVFLKFGQVHTSRELSLNAYDLGHLVTELAKKNGTEAITINSWTRYYQSEEGLSDYAKHPYFKSVQEFFKMADQNQWTIIDLKAIRADYETGKIKLPENGDFHDILKLINGYDYQLILPVDNMITYNIDLP
ncbi:MAG: hypothetical protein AAFO07_33565, partial [Bacteroidota bacterium]